MPNLPVKFMPQIHIKTKIRDPQPPSARICTSPQKTETKQTRTIPIRRHQEGVARDRHVPATKVVSRSSSSQNPTSLPIYAAIERKPENRTGEGWRVTDTCHRRRSFDDLLLPKTLHHRRSTQP